MAGTTENYGLTVWGREDEFCSPDGINGNFEAVDEALGTKVELMTGIFVGNGAEERTISLGRTPVALYLVPCTGATSGSSLSGGLLLPGHPILAYNSGQTYLPAAVEIVDGGFLVRQLEERVGMSYLSANIAGMEYRYAAAF